MRLARLGSSCVCRSRPWPARASLLCASTLLAAWCGLAARASADPRLSSQVVALRLEADADCVSIERLRSRVAATTWRLTDDAAESAQLELLASVLGQPDAGLLVKLQVRWRDGRRAERTVAAQSCEASLEALALLVQMTLDAERPREPARTPRRAGTPGPSTSGRPAANAPGSAGPSNASARSGSTAEVPANVPPSASARSGGSSAEIPANAPSGASPRGGPPAEVAVSTAPSLASTSSDSEVPVSAAPSLASTSSDSEARAPASAAPGESAVRAPELGRAASSGASAQPDANGVGAAVDQRGSWHSVTGVVAGVSFGLGAGASPQLQPGVGVFGGLGLHGVGIIRPWFQIELAHAWASGISRTAGRADFALDGGQLLLCPLAWHTSSLAAHGCAAIELARLRARGYDTYEPRTHARAWASAGAALWLRVPVWKLELQLGGALLHPLWRDQFSFAPDVFYSVPAWRWQLKLGLGARFL